MFLLVIAGRRAAANPESRKNWEPRLLLGFRVRAFGAPRNDEKLNAFRPEGRLQHAELALDR
ncbi:MAG TPA: hypothetical protein VGJ01_10140, partial [Pseudolabrys sp.]